MSAHNGRNSAFRANNVFPWRWLALGTLVLWFAMMAPGCGGGGSDGGGGSGGGGNGDTVDPPPPAASDIELRQQFIQAIGEGFILPTYAMMEQASNELVNSVETFCGSPSQSSLATAQEQWRELAGLWAESELVIFGPAFRERLHDEIDAPRGAHADASGIEARIAASGNIVVSRFTDERGLEGSEYLLFGDPDANNPILDSSASTWQRRCAYLQTVVEDLQDQVGEFFDIWRPGGGDHVGEWNTAGGAGNSTYPFVQDAINDLMGRMEFVLDTLVNVNLAGYNPAARRRWVDGEPESWRSGNSIANIRHRIEAAEMIYLGSNRNTGQDGFGIDEYLQRTGESGLASQIRSQFDLTYEALDAIPGTLREAVQSQQSLGDVVEAVTVSRSLLGLLKRDMSEHLDVFFGFNDADGD